MSIGKNFFITVVASLFVVIAAGSAEGVTEPNAPSSKLSRVEPSKFPPAIEMDSGQSKYDLRDWKGQKILVIIAQGNGCPVMRQNYAGFLSLEREFSKSASFIFINGNPQDSAQSIQPEAKSYGIEGRVGLDRDQKWLKAFGLKTIGEAAVATLQADGSWTVVYIGGINDRVNFDRALAKPRNEFLKSALQDIAARREVKRAIAPTFGCSITFN